MTTMNDKYGDGSSHEVCNGCGYCKTCGDCDCEASLLLPTTEAGWTSHAANNTASDESADAGTGGPTELTSNE